MALRSSFLLVFIGLAMMLYWLGQMPTLIPLQPMSQTEITSSQRGGDFRSFWAQGHLAAQGRAAEAYSQDQLFTEEPLRHLAQKQGMDGVSLYPPTWLLLMESFGYLSYPEAWRLYFWISLGLLTLGVVAAFPQAVWALPITAGFGAVWVALDFGQNSVALTGIYLLLMASAPRYEGRMAACLALASTKPHLGVLMPLWLVLRKQWMAFLWTLLALGALVMVVTLRYGQEIWQTYADAFLYPFQRLQRFDTVRSVSMITTYAAVRDWGSPPLYALGAQVFVALLALWGLIKACRVCIDPQLPFAIAIVSILLFTPHAYVYDLALLIIPLLVIIRHASERRWTLSDYEVVIALYIIPPFTITLNSATFLPVTPLLLLFVLWHLVRLAKHS